MTSTYKAKGIWKRGIVIIIIMLVQQIAMCFTVDEGTFVGFRNNETRGQMVIDSHMQALTMIDLYIYKSTIQALCLALREWLLMNETLKPTRIRWVPNLP